MIYIDISFLFEHKTGIGAYAQTLIECLSNNSIECKSIKLRLPLKIKWKTIWHMLWLDTCIYLKCLLKKPDIFISPDFIMPHFLHKNTKYITVVHDLCTYRVSEVTKMFGIVNRMAIRTAIQKADVVVSVSETVKNELIDKFNINPNKVKVIYNSIAKHFIEAENNDQIIQKYCVEKNKYILSVATLDKRKNIPELIKAFENLSDKYPDLKLVLVGGMGNENREKLTKHPNIVFTGYIPDEDIPSLYKNALLYMYPSLYEGFGIPLIEAQYCNCPVLCSDIPIFKEIAAESAEFCEPNSNNISKKLEYLINNTERLQELKIKGIENVKRFTIEKISKQLMEVING